MIHAIIIKVAIATPVDLVLPAALVFGFVVTAALLAPTAPEGTLVVLCLVIVLVLLDLDEVEVVLDIDVEEEMFVLIDELLLILVLPFNHCEKVGKV